MWPNDTGRREEPLGESARGLQYHEKQDVKLVWAEPEAVIMVIKNLMDKALIKDCCNQWQ